MEALAVLGVLFLLSWTFVSTVCFVVGMLERNDTHKTINSVEREARRTPGILWHPWFFGWRLADLVINKSDAPGRKERRIEKRIRAVERHNERMN